MDKTYIILWQSSINRNTCALGFRNKSVAERIAKEMKDDGYERVEILDLESMYVDSVGE